MPNPHKPHLIAENLSYELASTQTLFSGIHISLSAHDQIALVGANGTGKSTFLKLLTGQILPTQGSIHRNGSTYYLPQVSILQASLKQQSVLNFLSDLSQEWWEIEHSLDSIFSTPLDLALPIQSLSGGELTKLFLAIGFWQAPDFLLLDEPTNHLDYLAFEQLCQALCQFQGAFIIVSHKPFFLDQVTQTTWELTSAGLNVYGGNFSFYREQKQLEQAAKMRSHETARKALKRTKATAQNEQKRAAQSNRNGRQKVLNGSIPRIVAGKLQRDAQKVAGTLKVKHDEAIAAATQKVLTTKVKSHKATSIQLEAKSFKKRNLIEIHDTNLWVNDRLLIEDIQLQVLSNDRIAIAGPNGSGKSCLVKAMLGLAPRPASLPTSLPVSLKGGDVQLATMKTAYLDQSYTLVNRGQSVLENMRNANLDLAYQHLRQQLGHFLFFNDDVDKSAAVLSGGELARLAIAIITISQLDLLILDEPTNNLDLETVDQMVQALNNYAGSLLVISHDLDFLSRIGITHSFHLKHNHLKQTDSLPHHQARYHHEILNA